MSKVKAGKVLYAYSRGGKRQVGEMDGYLYVRTWNYVNNRWRRWRRATSMEQVQ